MRLVALVSFVLLWSGSTTLAQSPIATVEPPPLHLDAAVAWARLHHPALAAGAARIAAAQQSPEMARSLMPPMVDATIWQWPVTSINPADANMYMFMIEQELPGRGKRQLRATAADREVGRMTAEAGVREQTVVSGVRQAYAALRATLLEIDATRQAAGAARDLIHATEASYASGSGMQSSVVRAALAETELTERLAMLEADADMRRLALNSAMGRELATPIGELDADPPVPIVPSLAALLEEATTIHPELGAARAQVATSDAALEVARAEGKPDWVIQGGYMLMPGEAGAWTARVGLTWPTAPWAKKRLSAATREAEAGSSPRRPTSSRSTADREDGRRVSGLAGRRAVPPRDSARHHASAVGSPAGCHAPRVRRREGPALRGRGRPEDAAPDRSGHRAGHR